MRRRLKVQISIAAVAAVAFPLAAPTVSAAAPRPRTGGLTGSVLGHGQSGGPLAGATVRAYALPGLQAGCDELSVDVTWRLVATTITRSDGAFTLPLTTGYYRLSATPADLSANSFGFWVDPNDPANDVGDGSNVTGFIQFADNVFVPTGGRSGLTIHETTPAAVSGTVTDDIVDPGSGTPLAGAQVRGVQGGEYGGQTSMVYPSALTDATGHFVLAGLPMHVADPQPATPINEAATWGIVGVDPTGWHSVFIWWHTLLDQSPAPAVNPVNAADGDRSGVDFGMPATGRVSGRVVNERGRPVAGIEVDLWMAFPYPPAVTDSKGHFYLPLGSQGTALHFRDPAGKYRTAFYPGTPSEQNATLFSAEPGQETAVTMKMLGDAARVTGAAWYTIGQPAGGAVVGVDLMGGSFTYAGCDGSFNLGGLWPGATSIGFQPSIPDGNSTRSVHLTLSAGQVVDLGTVDMPTWIIDGRVQKETNGEPVAGARVDLVNVTQPDNPGEDPTFRYWADAGWPHAGTVTDDNGSFRVWLPDQPLGWPYLVVSDTQQSARFLTQVYDHLPLATNAADQIGDGITDDNPWDAQGTNYDVWVAPSELDVQVVQDGNPQQDYNVQLLQFDGTQWQPVQNKSTDDNGYARFGVTADTDYRILVSNQWGQQEYYQDASSVDAATSVAVANLARTEVTVDFGPFGP